MEDGVAPGGGCCRASRCGRLPVSGVVGGRFPDSRAIGGDATAGRDGGCGCRGVAEGDAAASGRGGGWEEAAGGLVEGGGRRPVGPAMAGSYRARADGAGRREELVVGPSGDRVDKGRGRGEEEEEEEGARLAGRWSDGLRRGTGGSPATVACGFGTVARASSGNLLSAAEGEEGRRGVPRASSGDLLGAAEGGEGRQGEGAGGRRGGDGGLRGEGEDSEEEGRRGGRSSPVDGAGSKEIYDLYVSFLN